jgi:hypothetical protein
LRKSPRFSTQLIEDTEEEGSIPFKSGEKVAIGSPPFGIKIEGMALECENELAERMSKKLGEIFNFYQRMIPRKGESVGSLR